MCHEPAPASATEAALLVIQADGKGVPIVRTTPAEPQVRLGKGDKRNRKKEAVVTGLVYHCPPPPHPGRGARQSLSPETSPGTPLRVRAGPQNKRLWATLAGKDATLAASSPPKPPNADFPRIDQRVALTDGAEALQDRVQQHFPTFTLVLDFIHADEKTVGRRQ